MNRNRSFASEYKVLAKLRHYLVSSILIFSILMFFLKIFLFVFSYRRKKMGCKLKLSDEHRIIKNFLAIYISFFFNELHKQNNLERLTIQLSLNPIENKGYLCIGRNIANLKALIYFSLNLSKNIIE